MLFSENASAISIIVLNWAADRRSELRTVRLWTGFVFETVNGSTSVSQVTGCTQKGPQLLNSLCTVRRANVYERLNLLGMHGT